jgi:hypothetical protein
MDPIEKLRHIGGNKQKIQKRLVSMCIKVLTKQVLLIRIEYFSPK